MEASVKTLQMKKKKTLAVGSLLVAVLLLIGAVVFSVWKNKQAETEMYLSLSTADRETADLYAELYETSAEEVAKIQAETGDWDRTGKKLEKEFFTIPENTKYQMVKEGYSIEDLEEAERLSAKTGRKAIELARAKGKASENRAWSDVVKDSEILSAEEQMGLTKDQTRQLKERSLDKEERMKAAILILNGTATFDEIIKELDAGKTLASLQQ